MASRKANKERTHQKLVDATLKVLYRDGRSGLTTGRIAEAAGVAQPTFYVHFSDMEDALTQAADSVAQKLLQRLKGYRAELGLGAPFDLVRGAYAASVKALLREPKMAELFLRHRRDAGSPLGKRWAEITNRARNDLRADMKKWGLEAALPDLDFYAELIVGMTLTLVEGLLDKRIADRESALDQLANFTMAGLEKALTAHEATKKNDSVD